MGHRSRGRDGFTLMELIIVVVIVGILASLGIPSYLNMKEQALDKEAVSSLKLLRAANRYYRSKFGVYYPNGSTTSSLPQINANLSLDLRSNNWVFSVAGGGSFSANASRAGGNRSWAIGATPADPVCSGSPCP